VTNGAAHASLKVDGLCPVQPVPGTRRPPSPTRMAGGQTPYTPLPGGQLPPRAWSTPPACARAGSGGAGTGCVVSSRKGTRKQCTVNDLGQGSPPRPRSSKAGTVGARKLQPRCSRRGAPPSGRPVRRGEHRAQRTGGDARPRAAPRHRTILPICPAGRNHVSTEVRIIHVHGSTRDRARNDGL
jgi:hypothetical protein